MKTCLFCGELNGDERDVCFKCGKELPLPDLEHRRQIEAQMAASKKRGKTITIAVVSLLALIIAALILYNVPFTCQIDKTLSGVECTMDGQGGVTPATLTIKGTYTHYLINTWGKQDAFSGTFSVDLYPETASTEVEMQITYVGGGGYSAYVFPRIAGPMSSIDNPFNLWGISCTPGLTEVSIMISVIVSGDVSSGNWDGSWDARNGLILSFPAGTQAEAIQLMKDLNGGVAAFWAQYDPANYTDFPLSSPAALPSPVPAA